MKAKINLLDLDRTGLEKFFSELGEKSYRAVQLLKWIHKEGVIDFALMTNFSKTLREKLENIAYIQLPQIAYHSAAKDGTLKWVLDVGGSSIEMVYIPERGRGTLCVSSQVGCALNCDFCSTGKQGFNRNLTVAEIIGQVWIATRELEKLRNKESNNLSSIFSENNKKPGHSLNIPIRISENFYDKTTDSVPSESILVSEMQGAHVAQNRSVLQVREDSSNEATQQFTNKIELCRNANEDGEESSLHSLNMKGIPLKISKDFHDKTTDSVPSEFILVSEMQGAHVAQNHSVLQVRKDSSNEATQQFTTKIELCRNANEDGEESSQRSHTKRSEESHAVARRQAMSHRSLLDVNEDGEESSQRSHTKRSEESPAVARRQAMSHSSLLDVNEDGEESSQHSHSGTFFGSITNVVMMGMGEPLLNYPAVLPAMRLMLDDDAYGLAKRKVTLSTSGIVPFMKQLSKDCDVALAVSLHAANDELRNQLVPVNKKYPLKELLAACKTHFQEDPKRKITFEYVMLHEVNDSEAQAYELLELLRPILHLSKINLIPFNSFAHAPYRCSTSEAIEKFSDILRLGGIFVMVRKPRGRDVDAACGQLVGKVKDKSTRSKQWQQRIAYNLPMTA